MKKLFLSIYLSLTLYYYSIKDKVKYARNNLLLFILIIGTCAGCASWQKTPEQKYIAEKAKVELVQKSIDDKNIKIQDKGKAFLYGAKIANWAETNRSVAIDVSAKFLDLSVLAIGEPSIRDATVIRDITDGLLLAQNTKIFEIETKAAIARESAATNEFQYKAAQKELEKIKEQNKINSNLVYNAELKLKTFDSTVSQLQDEKELAIRGLTKELEKSDKLNEINSEKATSWDAENGFWASLNPFTDLWKFCKKMFTLGLIGGVLFVLFKVLEIFFPEMNIIGSVLGLFGKTVSKFVPSLTKSMDCVSNTVWTAMKHSVSATEDTLNKLKNQDIESPLIESYSNDYKFSKDEVKELLEKHSENIQNFILNNLSSTMDSTSKGIVLAAKTELNVAPKIVNVMDTSTSK